MSSSNAGRSAPKDALDSPEAGGTPAWAREDDCPKVDRYNLGPELGRGGMGRVHLGWDPVLRRLVAIKLLAGDDPEHHLRFLREARMQAKLEHPNICHIHDLGMDGQRPYIAMELILGITLSDLRPQIGFRTMAELFADMAGAVQAAHRVGLIHRDLKPANILVTGRGIGRQMDFAADSLRESGAKARLGKLQPHLVDFGLARDLRSMEETLSWAVMGTPAFMSPEQAKGEALGPATDIYSLGATLYAMLSGRPPYEGATLAGLLTQQAECGVRRIRKLAKEVPRDLETITMKCLEHEPAKRYASARHLEEDLRRFLAGEPIAARPVGPGGRLWRWALRKPTLAGTAAAGILTALILGGWNMRTAREGRVREVTAQRFALEIRDAEHLLRIERMMPVHDIRPAEGRLRERMAVIRKEIEQQGGIAKGPGYYALGRGHLALREFGRAIDSLDAAWAAGFQAPEVAYGRALARLRAYEERLTPEYSSALGPQKSEALRKEFVAPALEQLALARGARVDNPEYGFALAAWADGRHAEAEDRFRLALAQAPWLSEAWVGRYRNLFQWKWLETRDPKAILKLCADLEGMLQQARSLSPSSEEALDASILHAEGRYIQLSARQDRSEIPLRQATAYLEDARKIRPDGVTLVHRSMNLAIQRGFFQLSSGGDPGPLMVQTAAMTEEFLQRPEWGDRASRDLCLRALHHVYWIEAEAAWRFGRDPAAALGRARSTRPSYPGPEAHWVFPNLVEARVCIERGGNPEALFKESLGILQALPGSAEVFRRTIHGELLLDWATWLEGTGGAADAKAAEGIAILEPARRAEPTFAYTWYHLPALHALRARVALREGRDPSPHVRKALESARMGIAANPANAMIRLAAAQAHLADALARRTSRQDFGPALEEVRRHLDAGERANPRDFRLLLLRAQADCVLAQFAAERGQDPERALQRMETDCRKGVSLKADEPRFHLLLARCSVLRGTSLLAAGRSPAPAVAAGLRALRQVLALCPGQREAQDLRKKLEGLSG
ncbi:MAG: serine/threonine protein kinase [Acidobacteria bacterium]|nr:serine/threonine protein kinase [Acidobacteriota bacterium]